MKLNKYKKVSFLLSGTWTNLVELLKKNLEKKSFEVTSIISNNIIPINIKFIVNKFYKNILVKENQKRLINKKNLFITNRNSDFVEALMEFGALICKPKDPKCSQCCLNKNCKYLKFVVGKMKQNVIIK